MLQAFLNNVTCSLGLQECAPLLPSSAPDGSFLLIIIGAAGAVFSLCLKLWGEAIKNYLASNRLALLACTVFVGLFILDKRLLPFLVGIVPVAAGLLLPKLPILIPLPWLAKGTNGAQRVPSVALGKLLLISAVILYPLAYGADLKWQRIQEYHLEAQQDKILVTFVLPTRDVSGEFLSASHRDTSAILSESVFKEIWGVLVDALSSQLDNIDVLPEKKLATQYDRFREKYNPSRPETELARVLTLYRQGSGSPVDFVIRNHFASSYKEDRPELLVTISIRALDRSMLDLKFIDWKGGKQLKGRDDELRRLSLVGAYELLTFLLEDRQLITLPEEDKRKVWNTLIKLFKEYYYEMDRYKEDRTDFEEIHRIMEGEEPCKGKLCLDRLASAYRQPPRDENAEERLEREYANASSAFKIKDEGVKRE